MSHYLQRLFASLQLSQCEKLQQLCDFLPLSLTGSSDAYFTSVFWLILIPQHLFQLCSLFRPSQLLMVPKRKKGGGISLRHPHFQVSSYSENKSTVIQKIQFRGLTLFFSAIVFKIRTSSTLELHRTSGVLCIHRTRCILSVHPTHSQCLSTCAIELTNVQTPGIPPS